MKNQFNIVPRNSSDYEKSDLIQTQFRIKAGIVFMILDSDYGDEISLRISGCDKIKSVNFYKLQIIDNYILNQARHLVCADSSILMEPIVIDIVYRSDKCTKPSVYYASLKTLNMVFGVGTVIYMTCTDPCLVMDNDQKYCITFDNDRYVILVDENYKDHNKLPGISFAKLPLEKEKIKNVLTFDNTEDAKMFLGRLLNRYVREDTLPETNADICILLRAFKNDRIPIAINFLNKFNVKLTSILNDEED